MASNELFRTVDSRYGRLKIFANDSGAVSQSLMKYGEWAENELSFLHAMVDEGATVIDVGAYIGTHALAFSRFVGPSGHVIAIEPQTRTFEVLKGNIEANAIDNVRLEHAVASFESGDAIIPSIDIERQDSFGSASLRDASHFGGSAADLRPHSAGDLTVRVTTIDDLGIADCALIKIDVEGTEDFVLRGGAETIRRYAPIIYAECNSLECGLKSLETLKAFGYRVFAHVVSAYNPGNFLGDDDNLFGTAREVALVAAAGRNLERIERYQVRECEMLLDIETVDDLALALLNKPQYEPEVLRAGAAAKSGGVFYLDEVVANRLEAERLRNDVTALRPLAIERAQEVDRVQEKLDRTDAALAEAQRLAVERAEDIERLHERLDRTDAALAEAQRLAVERAQDIERLHERLDRTEATLAEAQRLAVERALDIERLQKGIDHSGRALAEAQRLAALRSEEVERLAQKADSSILQAGLARQEANRWEQEADESQQEANRLQEEADRLQVEHDLAQREYDLQRAKTARAEAALALVYRSNSWRLSAPVRAIATLLRRGR